jgi:AraC-like DNA-binding protein
MTEVNGDESDFYQRTVLPAFVFFAMAKTPNPRDQHSLESYLKSLKGDALNYSTVFTQMHDLIEHAQGVLVTSLPRGGLQIVQPGHVAEPLLRAYVKEFHSLDRPTWTAIAKSKPIRATDCWPTAEYQSSRYLRDFLAPHGLSFVASAPLTAPVLEGYPGALTLFRTQEQGRFVEDDVSKLREIAAALDEAILRARSSRKPSANVLCPKNKARTSTRQFVFDQQLKPRLGHDALEELDDRLRQQMVQHARQRFEHLNGKATVADRLPLPDSNGGLWNFRVVVHRTYPALGEGAFVFFCLQPDCGEWSVVRPADFQADNEVSRLIPAMRFMEENFSRGPTLNEISRTAHLSPFHFHRRFTELLGVTPKHFMLDCQIAKAKRELLAREKELAQIAADCGFAHQSHFTSRFKQATGLTPTRWRRLALDMQRAGNNN